VPDVHFGKHRWQISLLQYQMRQQVHKILICIPILLFSHCQKHIAIDGVDVNTVSDGGALFPSRNQIQVA